MKKRILLFMMIFIGGIILAADDYYQEKWKEIKNYESKNLTKSAEKTAREIYERAKIDNNGEMRIKALLHIMKYVSAVEEAGDVKGIAMLKENGEKSQFPDRAVFYSLLGEQYWRYYRENIHKISSRTEKTNDSSENIEEWDKERIINEAEKAYWKSLEKSSDLQKIGLNRYKEIIIQGDDRGIRDSLYELLAYRGVEFYISKINMSGDNSIEKINDDTAYFLPSKQFSVYKFEGTNRLIELLQNITEYQLSTGNKSAVENTDLKRVQTVYNLFREEGIEKQYVEFLEAIINSHDKSVYKGEAAYMLADYYYRLGETYTNNGDESKRWLLKKAYDIAVRYAGSDNSYGSNNCKYIKEVIERKNLSFQHLVETVPEKYVNILLKYKNMKSVTFKIVKVTDEDLEKVRKNSYFGLDARKYYNMLPEKKLTINLPEETDFQEHSTEIAIPPLSYGEYIIIAESDDKNGRASGYIKVNKTAYLMRKNNKNNEIYIIDRESGKPIEGAVIREIYFEYDQLLRAEKSIRGEKEYVTDKKGYVSVPMEEDGKIKNRVIYEIEYKKQKVYTDSVYNYIPYIDNEAEKREKCFLFTDRAVYRPGQMLYYKAVVFSGNGIEERTVPGKKIVMKLYDMNRREIGKMTASTNEFGSTNGKFTIPEGIVPGMIYLEAENMSQSIMVRVEEYKRPKFEVKIEEPKKGYKLDEVVELSGNVRAFAGYAIENGKVRYKVFRSTFRPWSYYRWGRYADFGNEEKFISSGETATDNQGNFDVKFKAISGTDKDASHMYRISVEATDITGETQSTELTITAGAANLYGEIDIPESINKDENYENYKIKIVNNSNVEVPAKGKITIYKAVGLDRVVKARLWREPDRFVLSEKEFKERFPDEEYNNEANVFVRKRERVQEIAFDTGKIKTMEKDVLLNLQEGEYIIEIDGADIEGNTVKYQKAVHIYSGNKGLIGKVTPFFVSMQKGFRNPGEKEVIYLGSSYKDMNLLVEVERGGVIERSEIITLNNEIKKIEIPVTERHRGNFSVSIVGMRGNRNYEYKGEIKVPWNNKKLNLKLESFREKMQPGDKEKWRIKIGDKEAAEVLLTMYDASLDTIEKNNWEMNIYKTNFQQLMWGEMGRAAVRYSYFDGQWKYTSALKRREYSAINWFGADAVSMNMYSKRVLSKGVVSIEAAPMAAAPMEMKENLATGMSSDAAFGNEVTKQNVQPPEIRKNFAETPFFYPEIRTDSDGNSIVEFTAPDTLTKWRILGLGHTKNGKIGYIDETSTTQKEIMVMPNLPRFFREGDVTSINTKIVNLSEQNISIKAILEVRDAETMKVLEIESGNSSILKTINANESIVVDWSMKIPKGLKGVNIKIFAVGEQWSDGEERIIPVLDKRVKITEAKRIQLKKGEKKAISVKEILPKNSEADRVTFEYTSNPAWNAVLALPYLMEYPYECSEQIFGRVYANMLASKVTSDNSEIKEMFKKWKETENNNVFISNLQKNSELKSILLDETPWAAEGRDESKAKKRIGLLFDTAKINDETKKGLEKLAAAQNSDGGWPWFKGMKSNRFITQYIIGGTTKLIKIGALDLNKNQGLAGAYNRAVKYIDREIEDDYSKIKRENLEEDNLGYYEIYYLYVRSMINIKYESRVTENVYNYYLSQAEKYWSGKNKYMQGMIALVMHKAGKGDIAKVITASLKENAIDDNERGMYWKEFAGGYYWYTPSIEAQALMIEVFSEVAKERETVEKMKLWLLKEKHTTQWRTTKATAEACYALFAFGDKLTLNNNVPEIKIDDENIDSTKIAEDGTGYIKLDMDQKAKIEVSNVSSATGWGALYVQYYSDMEDAKSFGEGLTIKKEMLKEVISENKIKAKKIDKDYAVKVGDTIISRLVISSDRNLEFVHLKDLRGAAFEPVDKISGYKYQERLSYYMAVKDNAMNIFIDYLPKGTYVIEYRMKAERVGVYSNGTASIQCMYAPEFSAGTYGEKITIK